jgi:uncharacterized coiled-coil DUF342 family protein
MSKRDEYIEKMKAKLDELNAGISRLEAKARESDSDLRIKYEDEVQKMKQRRSEAKAKLDEFQQAGKDAWQDLKTGLQGAWDSLDSAIKSANERFK